MPELVYMDHAATTPVDACVARAMLPYLSRRFGNASTLYRLGVEAKEALENARRTVADAIKADPKEVIFLSGGSESDNLALQGAAYANRLKGKHIITTKFEHHAVLHTCEYLERKGFDVTYVPVSREGLVDPAEVERVIQKDTILISVMHANNEIGTIQPIAEIGEIAREKGILFHTDTVQTFGKLPIDVNKFNVDLLSISAHKIYGPKGVGALYVRKNVAIKPLIYGGAQEHELRAGTENIAGAVALATAAKIALKEMPRETSRQRALRDRLIKGVLEIGDSRLNGHAKQRLSNNANFSFKRVEGESIVLGLDEKGVCAGTGSACATHKLKPSHVLLAIGLSPEEAHGSLRLTLGRSTTSKHIDYIIEILPGIVSRLRKISPRFAPKS